MKNKRTHKIRGGSYFPLGVFKSFYSNKKNDLNKSSNLDTSNTGSANKKRSNNNSINSNNFTTPPEDYFTTPQEVNIQANIQANRSINNNSYNNKFFKHLINEYEKELLRKSTKDEKKYLFNKYIKDKLD